MLIIEGGCRKAGKSFTISVLRRAYPNFIFYKDNGMKFIADTEVDPDDYVIGRDLAYAQILPIIYDEFLINNLIFDRQYWSSYVYGQAWRSRYSKNFWVSHIRRVEDTYGEDFIKRHLKIIFITLSDADFDRIQKTTRNKDQWEDISDYKRQYELYQELLSITSIKNIYFLPAFQTEETIVNILRPII